VSDLKKPYYVYVYRDPRPGKRREPIYVGKSKGGNRRIFYHWKCMAHKNVLVRHKLAKIRAAGLRPIMRIVRRFRTEKAAHSIQSVPQSNDEATSC
jgi:hypothetical protein